MIEKALGLVALVYSGIYFGHLLAGWMTSPSGHRFLRRFSR